MWILISIIGIIDQRAAFWSVRQRIHGIFFRRKTMAHTLTILFRNAPAAIVYSGYPYDNDDTDVLTVQFQDGREWPEDLTDVEVGMICGQIDRHARAAEAGGEEREAGEGSARRGISGLPISNS
jgi:hypothetical protein